MSKLMTKSELIAKIADEHSSLKKSEINRL